MVEFRKHILNNGLTVLTHEAWDTPLATVNILYNVGSRDEDPGRTGFAHLFEHLMFGGTKRVPDFDHVVSSLGGESNAFTNNDYTNYYMTVPADGLPTALSLEADRMGGLDISQKALEVQQRVVTEEYNQRYMNQPYGDVWLLLRPLCYKQHPYRWCTIGADIRHVSEARLEDVRAFHERHYRPDNAILATAAPVKHEEQLRMVEEAFGSGRRESVGHERSGDDAFGKERRQPEPEQTERRELRVTRKVPSTMVYLAYPMCDHYDDDFRTCDLISDLLGNGRSSRLHGRLVRDLQLLTEVDACITGDAGRGLLVMNGKLRDGVDIDEATQAMRQEAMALTTEKIGEYELQKVVNRYENTFVYSNYKAADRAMGLCYYTWLGDTNLINDEPQHYRNITTDDIQRAARRMFRPENENRLVYEAER